MSGWRAFTTTNKNSNRFPNYYQKRKKNADPISNLTRPFARDGKSSVWKKKRRKRWRRKTEPVLYDIRAINKNPIKTARTLCAQTKGDFSDKNKIKLSFLIFVRLIYERIILVNERFSRSPKKLNCLGSDFKSVTWSECGRPFLKYFYSTFAQPSTLFTSVFVQAL